MTTKNEARKARIQKIAKDSAVVAVSFGVVTIAFAMAYVGAKEGAKAGILSEKLDIEVNLIAADGTRYPDSKHA